MKHGIAFASISAAVCFYAAGTRALENERFPGNSGGGAPAVSPPQILQDPRFVQEQNDSSNDESAPWGDEENVEDLVRRAGALESEKRFAEALELLDRAGEVLEDSSPDSRSQRGEAVEKSIRRIRRILRRNDLAVHGGMLFKSSELERLRNAGFVLRGGKLWVRDPCNVCRASGRIPCPGCKGTGTRTEDCIHCDSGRVLCPRCGGAGRMPCEECRGMRSLACPDCSGVGKLRCERCGGRGRMERGCGHCGGNRWQHGSGTVRRRVRGRDLERGASWEIDRVTCPRCRGAGVLSRPCSACRATGAMQCPRCRGAGVLACERCGGKGWMECEHTQECLYCGGRGTLEAACSRCRGEETIPCDECGGRGFTGTSEPVRPVPPEEIETGGGVVFFKVGAGNPGETGTKSGSPRDSSPAERNADDSKPGG